MFLKISQFFMMFFNALVTLSTTVMLAVCAVLESGFKSTAITVFFISTSAFVLSPSSSITKTTSEENIPLLQHNPL